MTKQDRLINQYDEVERSFATAFEKIKRAQDLLTNLERVEAGLPGYGEDFEAYSVAIRAKAQRSLVEALKRS